jgi:hypothetical protein
MIVVGSIMYHKNSETQLQQMFVLVMRSQGFSIIHGLLCNEKEKISNYWPKMTEGNKLLERD